MTAALPWIVAAVAITVAAYALLRGRRHRADRPPPQDLAALTQIERIRAANEERTRIYRDLHDDIGAKLLTLIHSLEDRSQADLARAVMQDLRDIVSRASHAEGSLLEILARIRDETEQRLDVLGITLLWEQDAALPDPHLDDGQALHLFRIVREAVTNALRHAHPRHMRIRSRQLGSDLVLDVTDDGPTAQQAPLGSGTTAMRRRAEELQGTIQWSSGTEGGTKVLLRFPLPNA